MVQRKTCLGIESFSFQPETRFGQEHLKNLGPEMMMMKRTKPRRKLKDNKVSSQSGMSQATPKHDLVVKVTGGSPNYMKGTSSSEARKENKKRLNLSRNQKNQTGSKHDSRYGVNKERSHNKPSSRIGRGLTKAPSFKRCSQRATCSSTLKDSKFPEYLMLNHGDTYDEVNGTSVLKVCPYTYCSLNGHLHSEQYPPLKSFISLKRQSLKSKKSVKMEASKEEFVKMELEEKKEFEHGNGNGNGGACEVDIDSQISETVSQGAPRSETDSDDYSDSAEMVMFSEGDHDIESKESGLEETLVDDYVNEVLEKANGDGDAGILKESGLEETLVEDSMNEIQDKGNRYGDADQSDCFDSEVNGIIENSEADNAIEETLVDDFVKDLENTTNIDEDANQFGCFSSEVIDMTKNSEADNAIEETLVDDPVKEIQEKESKDENADQSSCFITEVINTTKNSAAGNAIENKDDAGEETLEDKPEDCKEESQDQTEVIMMTEENAKVPFIRTRKPCNQEEPDSTNSWTIIKCKKPVVETEDLRAFNPREPNYLPIVVEEDGEKVDLKHQDIDERRNSEDWMFDYALQRAVSKLAPARKRKVALLVEAFETVQPIMPHGREPAPVLSYERHLQACN